jgi:pilus assembly protein Flp/PilA
MRSDFKKLSSVIYRLSSRFADDESGASAIEYALFAGLISLAMLSGWNVIGTSLSTRLQAFANEFAP